MKAVGYANSLPIDDPESLIDIELPQPMATKRDLLVKVRAIAVNPVDFKIRQHVSPSEGEFKVLGWDAVGEVVATGEAVTLFNIGDVVYYAGDLNRQGSNAEYQLVDERLVGVKPNNLSDAEAAALPLTAITAWEALFDRLGISQEGNDSGKTILIIGGAGGVGSIAIQLASNLAKLHVIATASRAESRDWCLKLGANQVINHRKSLSEELAEQGAGTIDYIFCLNNTQQHWPAMCQIVAPQGFICSIVETPEPVELDLLKSKSATFVWEFMFTRSMYQTPDMIEQHRLLAAIARLIDEGHLVTTVNEVLRPINADNLRKAHTVVEDGRSIGKTVLEGWA